MNPTEHTLWVSVIIVGFVVVVAVAALLSLLIYLIKRIDHRVDTIGIIIVLVVVALVVPILMLARSIGNEAPKINDALTDAVKHTAPLGALRTTIEHATIIIGGLQRGRARLGG